MPNLTYALVLSIAGLVVATLLLLAYALILRLYTEDRAYLLELKTPCWQKRVDDWLDREEILDDVETNPRQFLEFLTRCNEEDDLLTWERLGQLITAMGLDAYLRNTLLRRNPYGKAWALHMIGLFRLEQFKETLQPLLEHPHPLVNFANAMALARLLKPKETLYFSLLTKLVSNAANWSTEKLAGIVIIMGPEAGSVLFQLVLANQVQGHLLWFIIDIVGEMGLQETGPILLGLLNQERETVVHTVRSLGLLGYKPARKPLQGLLQHPEWMIRAQAARALGQLKDARALDSLAVAMEDSVWWVRRNAGVSLANFGSVGRERLQRIAHSSPDSYAREMARLVLYKEGGSQNVLV